MPTLQEEMSKVLDEWNKPKEDTPMKSNQFAVTTNVTRATFDFVKANPGLTATEAANRLREQGYNAVSVSAIMAQMARAGSMRKEGFKYYAVADEYVPIRLSKASKIATAEKLGKAIKSLEVLAETAKPAPTTITHQSVTRRPIVENMTLREAHDLYVELGKYFGA